MAALTIRPLADDDLEAVASIALADGQGERESGRDPRYLELLQNGGAVKVAVDAGRVVGWGGVRELPHVSILTDLFLVPDRLGEGIGRRLLGELWPVDGTPRATFASSDPRAMPLYVRFGAVPRSTIFSLRGAGTALAPSEARVESATAADAAAVELALTDSDRAADYAYWLDAPASSGLVVTIAGVPVGAGAAHAGDLLHLATRPEHSVSALLSCLRELDAAAGLACLPGEHPALRLLLGAGYRVVDRDLLMASDPGLIPVTNIVSPGLG